MAQKHHMPETDRTFCSSIHNIYGAMHQRLTDQRLNYAEELGDAFGEHVGEACYLIAQFLRGEELSGKDKQKVASTLQSLVGNKALNHRLQEIIFQEHPKLSKEEIMHSIDQIKESKEFLESFFLKTVRKEGTDENNISDENFEAQFHSDHLINALRADIKLVTPEIKLRMDIENKNGYNDVGPWHKDLAVYQKDGKYGIVNKQGKEILEAQEEYIHLHDDYIRIGKKFYDHTMKLTHDLSSYRWVLDPSEGLIGVRGRKDDDFTGYIDQATGEKVITLDPRINHIGQFKDGLAKIRDGKSANQGPRGECGYIDRTGKIVIPCEYNAGSQNENGYMLATKYGSVGDGIEYRLYLLQYDGTEYTEDRIDPEEAEAWNFHTHFDYGADRDRTGFVGGKFTLHDYEYKRRITIDTDENVEESEKKIIEMKSGMKVIVEYKNKEENDRFNCKILDKDGKQIAAPSEFKGVDEENDLIFVGDGIVTPDGEYIGPLKEWILKKYFKMDHNS